MGLSAKDLLAKTSSPERSKKVCLNGNLRAERDELLDELDGITGQAPATMGTNPRALEIRERVKALEAEMADSTVTFRFRGLSRWRVKEIQLKFPSDDPRLTWDTDAGASAFIAESLIEPKLNEAEVREFLEHGNARLADELFSTAWLASHQENDVPKSVRASAPSGGNA